MNYLEVLVIENKEDEKNKILFYGISDIPIKDLSEISDIM